MFFGEYVLRMDSRGRLVIPAKFREQFSAGLVITKGFDRCLFVYTTSDWAEIFHKWQQRPLMSTSTAVHKYTKILWASVSRESLSGQGRITLSQNLRAYAGLKGDCAVLGAGLCVEIWDLAIWRRYVSEWGQAAAEMGSEILPEQEARLRELAVFERRSETIGGVFISYSRGDNDVVDALAYRFDRDQINYWRDEKDLLVGDVIDKAISKGIQEALVFLIVLTPTSISSRWVERELDEAAHEETEGRKVVLPIVAKNLSPERIPPRLRRKLYVDVSESFHVGYNKLIRSIRHHLASQI